VLEVVDRIERFVVKVEVDSDLKLAPSRLVDLKGWLHDPNFRFREGVLVQDKLDRLDELGDVFLIHSPDVAAPLVSVGGVDLGPGGPPTGEGDSMRAKYNRFMYNLVRLRNHLSLLHLQFIIIIL